MTPLERTAQPPEDHPGRTGGLATVVAFARLCDACRDSLHTRCWERLGEPTPCPCGCWDDHGALTEAALLHMARRQPEALSRHIRFSAEFTRGTFGLHLRTGQRRYVKDERIAS